MSRGYTLLESATVLALLATTVAVVAPPLRRYTDEAAVTAAREAVAGLVARARVAAIGSGGATVRLRADVASVWLYAGGELVHAENLAESFGVTVGAGRRSELVLEYDALGLGRIASATIAFQRGDARSSLVVSSFGRVRRR